MKTLKMSIAVVAMFIGAAIMLVMPASAKDLVDEGQVAGNAVQSGDGKVVGNADGEGEANFSMSFTARGKTKGNFDANGNVNGQQNGYGYTRTE